MAAHVPPLHAEAPMRCVALHCGLCKQPYEGVMHSSQNRCWHLWQPLSAHHSTIVFHIIVLPAPPAVPTESKKLCPLTGVDQAEGEAAGPPSESPLMDTLGASPAGCTATSTAAYRLVLPPQTLPWQGPTAGCQQQAAALGAVCHTLLLAGPTRT